MWEHACSPVWLYLCSRLININSYLLLRGFICTAIEILISTSISTTSSPYIRAIYFQAPYNYNIVYLDTWCLARAFFFFNMKTSHQKFGAQHILHAPTFMISLNRSAAHVLLLGNIFAPRDVCLSSAHTPRAKRCWQDSEWDIYYSCWGFILVLPNVFHATLFHAGIALLS